MHAGLFALFSVVLSAFNRIIFRIAMRDGAGTWSTLIVFHAGGFLALFLVLDPPSLQKLHRTEAAWLLLASAFWTLAGVFDTVSQKYLDAAVGETIGCSTLILVTIGGLLIFGESPSFLAFPGILLIITAVLINSAPKKCSVDRRGLKAKLGAVACAALAIIIDKHLAQTIDPRFVTFSGFLLPAAAYIVFSWRTPKTIMLDICKHRGLILLTPLLGALSYHFFVQALAGAALFSTGAILETGIIFVFIFEFTFLGVKTNLWRRGFACASCALGAALVCI